MTKPLPLVQQAALEEARERARSLARAYFEQRWAPSQDGTARPGCVTLAATDLSLDAFDFAEQLMGSAEAATGRQLAHDLLHDLAHRWGRRAAREFRELMHPPDTTTCMLAGLEHLERCGWGSFQILATEASELPSPAIEFASDDAFEAAAWRHANRTAQLPACALGAGYFAGWCEESFSKPLVAREVSCRGQGHEACRFALTDPNELLRIANQSLDAESAEKEGAGSALSHTFFSGQGLARWRAASQQSLQRGMAASTTELRRANERLLREMEEREQIQRRLQKTQRLESLGRLAGGIAHDFNNLLGVIMGYSSVLQRRVSSDDPSREMLAEITEAAQLAAHLTRQLLTFSRARILTKQLIDLNEVIRELSNMLRRLLGDSVKLQIRLAQAAMVIEADASQIEQMLMNFAVNARAAMPEGGTLVIETELIQASGDAPKAQVTVTDNGLGMPEEVRRHVFEPFFTTKQQGEGTGLGLSTVYGIVTQTGGTIRVESAPQKGCVFTITLPLVQGKDPILHRSIATAPQRSGGETVLLVEDRIGFRALMADLLGDAGYQVLVAHNTDDALRISQHDPGTIHALVTDIVMPGMKGDELARRVVEQRPTIAVLYMSGYGEHPEDEGPLAAGQLSETRTGFIAKPFTPEDLNRELRAILDEET